MGFRGDFGPHWLGITWSLAVEEQFYLFIPLIIYFLPRSTIFYCFLIAILIAPILRCVLPDFFAFVNMPSRADSLLSGGCLAILVRSPRFMATVKKHHQFLLPLFMTLLLGTAIMTFRRDTFGAFTHFWLAALYSVLILISLVYSDGVFSRILQSRVLVWFGTLSYGIYMFHEAVSGLLHGFLRGGAPSIKTLSDAGITVLAFLLTLALAALSYRFLESPFLAISHRFRYTRRLSLQEAVK
jgi:peptidoglycan/LPS O-acetylase OafA/YrhL